MTVFKNNFLFKLEQIFSLLGYSAMAGVALFIVLGWVFHFEVSALEPKVIIEAVSALTGVVGAMIILVRGR